MSDTQLKAIIEGFVFASDKALSVDRLIKYFPEGEEPEPQAVLDVLAELQIDYEDRGVELRKVSTGYRFQVKQTITPWVSRLWDEKPARYTRALLETLALIVYRQPITRGEIEEIRGVAVSSNIIKTLQEREWVRIVGHRDVPGRPALYASTKMFLDYFNLESLEQLPPLSEIKDLDKIASELDPEKNAELIEAINEMQNAQMVAVDEDTTNITVAETGDEVEGETEVEDKELIHEQAEAMFAADAPDLEVSEIEPESQALIGEKSEQGEEDPEHIIASGASIETIVAENDETQDNSTEFVVEALAQASVENDENNRAAVVEISSPVDNDASNTNNSSSKQYDVADYDDNVEENRNRMANEETSAS